MHRQAKTEENALKDATAPHTEHPFFPAALLSERSEEKCSVSDLATEPSCLWQIFRTAHLYCYELINLLYLRITGAVIAIFWDISQAHVALGSSQITIQLCFPLGGRQTRAKAVLSVAKYLDLQTYKLSHTEELVMVCAQTSSWFVAQASKLTFAFWSWNSRSSLQAFCGVYRTVAISDLFFPASPKICIFMDSSKQLVTEVKVLGQVLLGRGWSCWKSPGGNELLCNPNQDLTPDRRQWLCCCLCRLTSNCPNPSCFVARARHSPAEVLEFCSGQIVPTFLEAAAMKLKAGLWNDLRSSESRCSSSSRDNSGFVTFPGCLLWEESDFLSCGVKQVRQFVPVSGCERAQSLHELWGSPNNKIPKYSFLFLVPEASPVLTFSSQHSYLSGWFLTFSVWRISPTVIFLSNKMGFAQRGLQNFPPQGPRVIQARWKSTLSAHNLHQNSQNNSNNTRALTDL